MTSAAEKACGFEDRTASSLCRFLERMANDPSFPVSIGIDQGTTATDFSDPQKPVQRYIGPDGQFTDKPDDGIKTAEEYYQAAIHLGEIAAGNCATTAALAPSGRRAQWAGKILRRFRDADFRVFWLFTDPKMFPAGDGGRAEREMRRYLKMSEKLWEDTASARDTGARRRMFAKNLHEAMVKPASEGGFGIYHFDPGAEGVSKVDHPFFSYQLDCVGAWLYGLLCERHGISATPVQQFTNKDGKWINHVIVGLSLDEADAKKLTLATFEPGGAGFDVSLDGSAFAPISRLELLAYVHLNRTYVLHPNDRKKQWQELEKAVHYAPNNYLVQYQLGVWSRQGGEFARADWHFKRMRELNPAFIP